MRLWNNPWARGIAIAILGTLLGTLTGHYLIPFIEYTCSQPRVEVVYPISGEAVYWHPQGSTVVGNHWKLQHNHIFVLIHPTDTPWWFVQHQATPLNENMWRAKVYYGTRPEEAGAFEIFALMTTRKLTPGEKYELGDVQELKRESSAVSNVVTANKMPTGSVTCRLAINVCGQGTTEPNPGSHTYNRDTRVSITASPASGSEFDHWGGDASGTSTSVSITMNSDKAVIAYFVVYSECTRECEYPDEHTVGQMIPRPNASGSEVHGRFGCENVDPWTARAGYVKYNVELHRSDHLYLVLKYSKNSPSTAPIRIYLDEETQPRAAFIPKNQGSWNKFTETEPMDLGQITTGTHTIKFSTDGQQYGVADLDKFTCSYLIE